VADAEILFAFDARLDRPPSPTDMPTSRRQRFAAAPMTALRRVFDEATSRQSVVVVLFGSLLTPARTSPGQVADVSDMIAAFTAAPARHGHTGGPRVIATASTEDDALDLAGCLGDPEGLVVLTPGAGCLLAGGDLRLEITCVATSEVEIASGPAVIDAQSPRGSVAGEDCHPLHRIRVRGKRVRRPRSRPADGTHRADLQTLASIQPRSIDEHASGEAGLLRISSEGRHHHWETIHTAEVGWQLVRTVCSPHEEEEELAATASAEVEQALTASSTPLRIVRLLVESEADPQRRARVARMAPGVLREIRQVLEASHDRAWCEAVEPDPAESLDAIATADDLGGSQRFTAMLACTAAEWPLPDVVDERLDPHRIVHEAAWIALELLEDD
jgi:hypothetical protein